MDWKTQQRLARIGKEIPKDLLKSAIKKEKQFAFEKDLTEEAIKNGGLSHKKKEWLKQMLDNPAIQETQNRTIDVVDEKKSAEIEKFVSQKIKQAIADGRMPPPNGEDKKFIQRLMDKKKV